MPAKTFPDSSRVVQHRRHPIESKTVKLVDLLIPTQIGQQKPLHLELGIIEQSRIPQLMMTPRAGVEETRVRPVELVQPVQNVFTRVRVDDVQQDEYSQFVSSVDEPLELLRRAVAARSGVEARHLIAEAGVIRVLHYGHQLDGVVALSHDVWQYVLGEVVVRSDLVFTSRYSHMALVDAKAFGLLGFRVFKHVFL